MNQIGQGIKYEVFANDLIQFDKRAFALKRQLVYSLDSCFDQ